MKLRLIGHDNRYAMEQILLMLFPQERVEYTGTAVCGDGATSALSVGRVWCTATAKITWRGQTAVGTARCKVHGVTESLRRQILRQSFYKAALPFLQEPPAWGALSGVRPTKLVSRHLMEGGNRRSATACCGMYIMCRRSGGSCAWTRRRPPWRP